MKSVVSPITGKKAVFILNEDNPAIYNGYAKFLGIDVKNLICGKEISLYECIETSCRFYHPSSLAGDEAFYEQLSTISWYYQDWKYEYEISSSIIPTGAKVLEVGCGKGAFLKHLKNKNIQTTGLELNKIAIEEAIHSGLDVYNETIEDHSKNNKAKYDFVISFQVLEHIYDVESFLKACIVCMKEGGKLIIAVPNNEAIFFKERKELIFENELYQRTILLNQPPHHMTLWNKKSLNKTFTFFGLKKDKFSIESLPEYRSSLVAELIVAKIFSYQKFPFLYKLSFKLLRKFVRRFRKYFAGDTIVAVFQK